MKYELDFTLKEIKRGSRRSLEIQRRLNAVVVGAIERRELRIEEEILKKLSTGQLRRLKKLASEELGKRSKPAETRKGA